jgi:hypothetical protein
MPRRKHTCCRRAEVNAQEVWKHRSLVEGMVSQRVLTGLTHAAWRQLVDDLMDALAYATAGLRGVVRGRNTRANAWTLDILYRDVSDALARAGITSTMHPDHAFSRTQSLVKEIAETFGLPGHDERGVGQLFTQAQRSREIEKRKLPDVLIEYTPSTGEMTTTIGDPGAPLVKKQRRYDPATEVHLR